MDPQNFTFDSEIGQTSESWGDEMHNVTWDVGKNHYVDFFSSSKEHKKINKNILKKRGKKREMKGVQAERALIATNV